MTDNARLNDALAANYMLVDLELRSWSGRRTDQEASREIISNKGAAKDSGRFVKYLFASADEELSFVHKMAGQVRAFVYANTLPWSGNTDGARRGERLIAATRTFNFLRDLNSVKAEYDAAVQALINVWPLRVASALSNLGSLADPNDYPDATRVQDMFGVSVGLRPVPTLGDFTRVNVPSELAEALGQRHAAVAEVQLGNAMDDLKERLLKELQRVAQQLGKAGKGEKTRLYDSLVTNMQALVDLVRSMNVTGKSELNQLADRIEKELLAKPVEAYRNHPAEAASVASAAESIAIDAALEDLWKL